jgi:ATP-dependent RNA circularization protein (DNA/RNA ligase family)
MFIVLYHVILIGIAPLIPIPFLDDVLVNFLWKHMLSGLADSYNIKLNKTQIATLTYRNNFSCSEGCLFIVNRIIRQFFPWWEWSRGVRLATDAYYTGFLLNELFSSNTFDETKVNQYAIAMNQAKKQVNVKLVGGAIVSTFRSSSNIVRSLTKWLSRLARSYLKTMLKLFWSLARDFLYRKSRIEREETKAAQAELNRLFEQTRPEFEGLINELISHLQEGLGKLPNEHFEEIKNKFYAELDKLKTSVEPQQTST